jgi:hypothetical protein
MSQLLKGDFYEVVGWYTKYMRVRGRVMISSHPQ